MKAQATYHTSARERRRIRKRNKAIAEVFLGVIGGLAFCAFALAFSSIFAMFACELSTHCTL